MRALIVELRALRLAACRGVARGGAGRLAAACALLLSRAVLVR